MGGSISSIRNSLSVHTHGLDGKDADQRIPKNRRPKNPEIWLAER